MKKWTDEEISHFGWPYEDCKTVQDAADHIRALQEAVEELRAKFNSSMHVDGYAISAISEVFWPPSPPKGETMPITPERAVEFFSDPLNREKWMRTVSPETIEAALELLRLAKAFLELEEWEAGLKGQLLEMRLLYRKIKELKNPPPPKPESEWKVKLRELREVVQSGKVGYRESMLREIDKLLGE